MRQIIVIVIVIAIACSVACTKPNPNVCCVTDAQCADLGADELRPCAVGQACAADFTCVAAECTTSADCASPDAPICSSGLCIGACTGDADCADVAGRPYCAPDRTCVGCLDASQCSADAAICDPAAHACRGCERDDECASGVCIEADGVCADESRLIFVSQDGVDDGVCAQGAPCLTLTHALARVTGARDVIRILGGIYMMGSESLTITQKVVIDGQRVMVLHSGTTGTITADTIGDVTLEGLDLVAAVTGDLSAVNYGRLHLFDVEVTLLAQGIQSIGGSLEITRSKLVAGTGIKSISCTSSGALAIRASTLDAVAVYVDGCATVVTRTVVYNDGPLRIGGGTAEVVNNLIIAKDQYTDAVSLDGGAGARFAFNTVVNVGNVPSMGVALACDSATTVTSNIFAYNSGDPIQGQGCVTHESLFDTPGQADADLAMGNVSFDASTFFVDRLLDFHLAPGSPGMGRGEPGIVDEDLEGHPRGAMPDLGAFEAP